MRVLVIALLVMIAELQCSIDQRARIFYINSYHNGYPPSDEIQSAIQASFSKDSFDLHIFHLDAKRDADSAALARKASDALAEYLAFDPDIVVTSDDAAIQYFLEPFSPRINVPAVYCGLNWSSAGYELKNATGILEVLPLPEMLSHIRSEYPELNAITILSEDSEAEQRNLLLLDTLFKNTGFTPSYSMVRDFHQWKAELIRSDSISGLIYLPTNGAIKDWNDAEAINIIRHLRSPTVTCDAFMMRYCALGFVKIASEQGIEASKIAKRILNGESVHAILEKRNVLFEVWVNDALVKKFDKLVPSSYEVRWMGTER